MHVSCRIEPFDLVIREGRTEAVAVPERRELAVCVELHLTLFTVSVKAAVPALSGFAWSGLPEGWPWLERGTSETTERITRTRFHA